MELEYENVILAGDSVCQVVRIGPKVWVGTMPVTQRTWSAVAGTSPSHFSGPDLPVESVSWLDAVRFCELATKTARMAGSSINGVIRLPFDSERAVYAADPVLKSDAFINDSERGRFSARHRAHCDEIGWFRANSGGRTHAVGEKPRNSHGVFDAYGNVWEWLCEVTGDFRTYLGGSWRSRYGDALLRCYTYSGYKSDDIGFRFAVEFR